MSDVAPPYTWVVIEDLAGMLMLFVFAGETETVVFARDHYERTPGRLRHDIACLRRGDDPAVLGSGLADAQARWDVLGPAGADAGGYWVIADHDEVCPAEAMGAAAWTELRDA